MAKINIKWLYLIGFIGLILVALLVNIFTSETFDNPIPRSQMPLDQNPQSEMWYIDLKGEVKHPGVYRVVPQTRLYQVISMAGGLTVFADVRDVNLSMLLSDEMRVMIPRVDTPIHEDDTCISLSRSTQERLIELPNIGPATAAAIIRYREEHGPFHRIEDVLNVSGIGPATFEAIKPFVCP